MCWWNKFCGVVLQKRWNYVPVILGSKSTAMQWEGSKVDSDIFQIVLMKTPRVIGSYKVQLTQICDLNQQNLDTEWYITCSKEQNSWFWLRCLGKEARWPPRWGEPYRSRSEYEYWLRSEYKIYQQATCDQPVQGPAVPVFFRKITRDCCYSCSPRRQFFVLGYDASGREKWFTNVWEFERARNFKNCNVSLRDGLA